ncbi:UvrD-helicase domain-containing protein [Motiliproteus sp. MSK22-1]|uniref:UvrD-helicase domain-containing protein n=1 Tax=Motiliproteus sp. MSK22-1 TaxID=1897630 RepID=UPI000976366D|nr:UvrD-helicase domain-containing protein [Motiliproteus sp. MSK22-1]OMH39681.1 helicase IV [Motiliproteus sp. MSK22-1]
MADVQKIETHWLGKWLGHRWKGAAINPEGIALHSGTTQTRVTWKELSVAPIVNKGIFFDAVVLRIDGKKRTVSWLSGKTATAFKVAIEKGWYGFHTDAALEAVEQIKRFLDQSGYLRISRARKITKMAAQALSVVGAPPSGEVVSERVRAPFVLLEQWANLDSAGIKLLQDQYVEQQKTRHKTLFNRIESNPLTEQQCRACIVDEDNNLVLAGAGTGKTSTMVGRAAYLIQSGQSKAKDILMLAFGSKAAQEMRERIEQRLDGEEIWTKTFHALGQQIITKVEGRKARITPLAGDQKRFSNQVDRWFQELLKDPQYRRLVIKYFQYYLFPEKSPFEFQSQGEYYDYLVANEIRTLKGEAVKSFEQCLIANWLFFMGIEYVYEHPYQEVKTRSLDFKAYLPDFYLVDYDIYIEYFSVDRNGMTAPYIDQEDYHAEIHWTRELHRSHQSTLIESFHFEQREGCLLDNLKAKLQAQEVTFDPLPEEAVLETLREFGALTAYSAVLSQLLSRFKANWFDSDQLKKQIASSPNPEQVEAAMKLLLPIFDQYQALLASRNEIDFDDMIGRAIEYVQSGRFKPYWRFILVDEFQDISEPRARLVKVLRDAVSDCSLFCVGDDWQAIYRFTGSDVRLTTGFEQYFGPTAITALDKTFRFNNSICDVASGFITQNPTQVKKQLRTHRQVQSPAVSLLRQSYDQKKPLQSIRDSLTAIAKRADPGSRVYLMARFKFKLPEPHEVVALNKAYPSLKIETLSFHAAKGKEADYVVILGLETGLHGFPSEKVPHPLLEALLPAAESYDFAEERRLFYVALTRAKHRVYLVCDMTTASRFVTELLDEEYPIELEEFNTSLAQKLFSVISCIRCNSGSLVPRKGKFGTFFGCSNYPRCNHAEKGCQQCGQAMKRQQRFKVCLDEACGHWVPVCPECGAEMTLRQGAKSQFWGCKNYRGQEKQSCGHTEAEIEYPVR